MEITLKPIEETENEIRIRLRDPSDFRDNSFRRITVKREKPRVFGIVGRLKSESTTTMQSLRFPKGDGWSKSDASKWAREHDFIKALVGVIERASGLPIEDDELDERLEGAELIWQSAEPEDVPEETRDEVLKLYALQLKSLPAKVVRFPSVAIKRVDQEQGEADIVISNSSIDRDREVVNPKGMKLPSPKRVPLVSSHNYFDLRKQIGDVQQIARGETEITARPRWFRGLGNPEADWAFQLVDLKVAAFSIGFLPIEHEDADLSDEKVVEEIMAGKLAWREHTKWELVEVSQVIVPSNRGAVQRMASAGIIEPALAKALEPQLSDEPMSEKASTAFEEALARWSKAHEEQPTALIEGEPEDDPTPAPQPVDIMDLFQIAAEQLIEHPQTATAGLTRVELKSVDVDALIEAVAKQLTPIIENRFVALEAQVQAIVQQSMSEAEAKVSELAKSAALSAFGPDSAAHTKTTDLIAAVMIGVKEHVDRAIGVARGSVDHWMPSARV